MEVKIFNKKKFVKFFKKITENFTENLEEEGYTTQEVNKILLIFTKSLK